VATSVAIARQPDLLLLDEPSNHLDLSGIEWLERSVLSAMGTGGVVVVSHDRELLDKLSTHLLHSSGGHGEMYKGSYSDFLRKSAVQEEALAQIGNKQGGSGKAGGDLQPPPLANRHRPSRFHLLTGKTSPSKAKRRGGAAAGKARRGGESSERSPMLALDDVCVRLGNNATGEAAVGSNAATSTAGGHSAPGHLGAPFMTGEGGISGAASPVAGLAGVCLTVERGEVVLLVGDNGAGKSTLLNAATGRHPLAGGQAQLSDEARLFFLPQDAAHALRGDQTAWEWMEAQAGDSTDEARRRTMRKMGIPSETHAEPLSAFSGGERTRLCIARMLLSRANLLILDEPTNHLDLLAREYLKEAIRGFDGAVLLVSHDRHFAAQVSTRVVELSGGKLREAGGDYRSYVRAREELHERLRAREIEGDQRAVSALGPPLAKREARRRRVRSKAAR
jgi:ATP-binding cassette subfamily F protein 3